MSNHPDIDIDFADRHSALAVLASVPAMIDREGKRQAHPSGVYLQNMPVDPFTKLAAVPYDKGDDLGYFKVDFLNQSVYAGVRDEDHLVDLLNSDHPWELLDEPSLVEQLPHIYKHFSVVQEIAPRSIEDLAVVLALVRPGKRHLRGRPRAEIDREIWKPSADGYTFKKAHAIAYAALVAVALNLLCEKLAAS